MDKVNFYDRQKVDETDLDTMQDFIENQGKALVSEFFGDGVLSGLQVTAYSPADMGVQVAPGKAYINGKPVPVNLAQDLTVVAADATNPRIDIVVIYWNQRQEDPVTNYLGNTVYTRLYDSFQLDIIEGTPAATPVAPETPAGGLKLAEIYVAAGATSISSANITDTRVFVPGFAELEAARGSKTTLDERLDVSLNEDGSLKHATQTVESHKVHFGSANFAGPAGVTITHNLGHTNYKVMITPTSDPSGFLGEVWVVKSANTIVVYNSGSATTAFDWQIAEVTP